VVADVAIGDPDSALPAGDALVLGGNPFLESRGCGDHLERRARLVDVGNRTIAPVTLRGIAESVRVEARKRRHRAELAGRRPHHDRDPAPRTALADGGCELGLGDVLKVLVEGEINGLPGDGALFHPGSRASLQGVAPDDAAPGLPFYPRLERVLDPPPSLVVAGHVDPHPGGGRAARGG